MSKIGQQLTNEEVFIAFLKNRRKYSAFKRNCINHYSSFKSYDRQQQSSKFTVDTVIIEAFIWSATKEGYWYWEKQSMDWQKLVSHFNLQGRIVLNL